MPSISEDGYVVLIPDFDVHSREDYCSVSALRKRDTDVGVFRPQVNGFIEHEGFFDISQYAVEQMAKMLGWLSPEEAASLQQRISELETAIEDTRKATFKQAADAVRMAGVRAQRTDA